MNKPLEKGKIGIKQIPFHRERLDKKNALHNSRDSRKKRKDEMGYDQKSVQTWDKKTKKEKKSTSLVKKKEISFLFNLLSLYHVSKAYTIF